MKLKPLIIILLISFLFSCNSIPEDTIKSAKETLTSFQEINSQVYRDNYYYISIGKENYHNLLTKSKIKLDQFKVMPEAKETGLLKVFETIYKHYDNAYTFWLCDDGYGFVDKSRCFILDNPDYNFYKEKSDYVKKFEKELNEKLIKKGEPPLSEDNSLMVRSSISVIWTKATESLKLAENKLKPYYK